MFQRIDKQVAQDDFALVLVEADYAYLWVELVADMDILRIPLADEILLYMLNTLVERMRLYEQFAFPYFHFSNIEYHVNQVLHAL